MSENNHDRFRHLERDRVKPLEEQPASNLSERFSGVKRAEPVPEPVPVPNRFSPEQQVAVEQNDEAEQPFVQCAGCGTEGGKFDAACAVCGARFDTAEQRIHNARIWEARKAQRAEEARATAEHDRQRALDEKTEGERKRAMGEALARDTKKRFGRGIDPRGWLESIPRATRGWVAGAIFGSAWLFAVLHQFAPGIDRHGNTIDPMEKAAMLVIIAGGIALKIWLG